MSKIVERLRSAHVVERQRVQDEAAEQKRQREASRAQRVRREALRVDAAQCVVVGDEHNLSRQLAGLVERIESVDWTEIIETLSWRFEVPVKDIEREVIEVHGYAPDPFMRAAVTDGAWTGRKRA